MSIDQETLKEYLSYDPVTGVFVWLRKTGCKVVVGSRAGSYGPTYAEVGILGVNYRLHRLAFLYMEGRFPLNDVDHIDGDKKNNSWNNLREVDRSKNELNKHEASAGKRSCKFRGVFRSSGGRWFSRIKSDGVLRHLGTYDTQEEAYQKYVEAKRTVMETWNG